MAWEKWRAGAQKRQYLWNASRYMKSYYGGPIGSHKRSFERYYPRPPMASPCPRFGVRNPNPKLQSPLSRGTSKAIYTGCKFGPWKIWEKRECGRIQGLPKFFVYSLLSQEWVKLRTSNFVRTFIGSIGAKRPLKISGKVAVGVLRDSRKFSGHLYIGRIARSSLR